MKILVGKSILLLYSLCTLHPVHMVLHLGNSKVAAQRQVFTIVIERYVMVQEAMPN